MPALGAMLGGAAVVAAVAAVALGSRGGEEKPPELPRVYRGCHQRVESKPIRPRAGRDAVIGPIAFYELPAHFEPEAQQRGRVGALNGPPMKAMAIVRAGRRVTIAVPPDQRGWMRLFYGQSAYAGGQGSHSVTFRSCRRLASAKARRRECGEITTACRSASTQFAGEIYVDYAAAPDQGRCARLSVRVRGEPDALSGYLFDPAGARCGDRTPQ
jgi:hypothetical protein